MDSLIIHPRLRIFSKRVAALLALCLTLVATSCHGGYRLVLTNGTTITSVGKPKYDSEASVYRFKDAHGEEHALPAFRVQEIEPL